MRVCVYVSYRNSIFEYIMSFEGKKLLLLSSTYTTQYARTVTHALNKYEERRVYVS